MNPFRKTYDLIGVLSDRLTALENRLTVQESHLVTLEGRTSTPEERENMSRATALLAAGWLAKSHVLQELVKHPPDPGRTEVTGPTLQSALAKLEAIDPAVFPIWKRLHENDESSYIDEIAASCSHWDHKYARLFQAFVSLFARGRLLDIGCGTNGRPSYLAGYPVELITGLDPRPSRVPTDFEYVQGFNEYLPWKDESFHTVVSGTSLDHVLALAKSLEEVRRVLVPGGVYLVWLGSIPGAKPYEPRSKDFEPADEFHLFHFDRKWIEPIFEKYFSVEEICVIPQPGFDHVFYCLAKKPG